ncbi:hypothetical protein EHH54_33840 [Rhizobium leguminosarum]|uniref:hypothetical protein n=1 Tax=Rhizobium leguminosarum TaxID=384 RepID=UPI000FEC4168|nr:hypothetical protein [Rhizobium leguminosarum]RWX27242.1 hypothetical protein EHH54_33840 [Rhizobium leguminosarum]
MSETDAVNHICEVTEFDEAGAKRALYDEFMAGKVEAHALVAEFTKTNSFWKSHREWQQLDLSLTGWRHSIVEWDNDCILISMNKPHEVLSIVAIGIEFQRADVLGVWPALGRDKTEIAPNKGGRPPEYDREEVDAAIIDYIIDKDPKTRAEVIRALQAEFGEESLPHKRTLEKIVSEVFKRQEARRLRGGKS